MAREKKRNIVLKLIGWLIFLGVVGGPIAYFYLHEDIIEVTVIPVTWGHVEDTITSIAAGTVLSKQDAMLAAGMLGTIAAVPEEGQRFQEGDVLVELDHDELDAQVALTEANLRVGQSRLEQVKLAATIYAEINTTKVSVVSAQLDLAKSEFDRIKSLSDRKAISESDMDKAASALRVAQEGYAAAKAALKENEIRQEEIRMTEATIEQLEAAATAARAARDRAFVKAPFPGVVGRRMLDVGEATAMGVPLMQFVRDDDCYVQAPFDEANSSDIKLGQKVRLNIDAYRDQDFMGEVVYVSPVINLNMDLSRTLDLKVQINEGKEKFIPGMSVDVTIIADERNDVVFVPSEALMREEFAFVVENGRALRKEVKTGVGNWSTLEVLDGLKEGDKIVSSLSVPGLDDGVKVRVVDKLEEE